VKLEKWLPLLVMLFLLGALVKLAWLSIFSTALAVFLGLAHLWSQHSLDNVSYKRRFHYTRGFPGESTQVNIEIENRKWLPLSWIKISDPWPAAVPPEPASMLEPTHIPEEGRLVNVYSLRWNERISRNYDLSFIKRGVHPVGPAELRSGDLFGLEDKLQVEYAQQYLTVFPELIPLSKLAMHTEDPIGERRARLRLFEDPNQPIGVRPYRPEDGYRRIHWPATARTGELQVKLYQPVTSRVVIVCLNVSTMSAPWLGTATGLLEELIKVSATLVYHGMQDGYAMGLISNGCLAHADHPFKVDPGRSPGQLGLLLQTLAAVTPFTTAPFESYLMKTASQLTYGAALIVVTALVSPGLCETLLRMKRYRSHLTLVSLEETPPPELPGVRNLHLPYQAAEPPEQGL
jgi:uncharacterized protein (DUF58 family)